MNRRNALRALAGAVAALPALLAAKPVAAQTGAIVAELDLDQIEEGTVTALLDAERAEPHEWVEIPGVQSVRLRLVGETGPELVTPIPGVYDVTLTIVDTLEPELVTANRVDRGANVLTGEIRYVIEDGG